MEPENSQQQVQVRVPDNIASGVYANIVTIHASKNEVVLDFVLAIPNQGQAVLASRVILSLEAAQGMSDLLEALIRQTKVIEKKKG